MARAQYIDPDRDNRIAAFRKAWAKRMAELEAHPIGQPAPSRFVGTPGLKRSSKDGR